MASVSLQRESTKLTGSVPPTVIDFDTWQTYPQIPLKVIEVSRRLGSKEIIRQDVGEQTMLQTSTAIKVFKDYDAYKTFVDDMQTACDKTTFYKFLDSDNSYTVPHVTLIDFTHFPKKMKGTLKKLGALAQASVVVEFQIRYYVDGDN